MDEAAEEMFNNWMSSLYKIALMHIGNDRMMCESWYYTNKNIWKGAFLAGFSPEESYEDDCRL